MNAKIIEHRLRLFLLGLASLMCLSTLVELFLIGHTKDPIQFLPFGLFGIALVLIGTVWVRPQRGTIYLLRIYMGLMILGGGFGTFEHVEENWKFYEEIQPGAPFAEALWETLTGANPLLAPGILAIVAIIAIAATYYHPVLGSRPE